MVRLLQVSFSRFALKPWKTLERPLKVLEGPEGPWKPWEIFGMTLKALDQQKRYLRGAQNDIVTLWGGGSTPVPFFSPNLPGPQKHRKWTFAHLKLDNQISYWSAFLPGKFSFYGFFWGSFPISGKKTWSKRKMLITLRNGFWYQLNCVHPFLPYLPRASLRRNLTTF